MPIYKNVKQFTARGMHDWERFIVESNTFHEANSSFFYANEMCKVLEAACHLDHALKVH